MLLKCAIGTNERLERLTVNIYNSISNSKVDYYPSRRDASKASPYTEKDKLTESEKEEISKSFVHSSLSDKYLHL